MVMDKATELQKEVELIQDEKLRNWVRETLKQTPDYFFKAPASSTGKYHPACTNKERGLLVHVQRVVYMANRLCSGLGLTGDYRDIVIASAILHDIAKMSSYSNFTDYENHPLNAEKFFAKTLPMDGLDRKIEIIKECVKHHMGLWSPKATKKPLDKYNRLELVVYISDYFATTKEITTPVDVDQKENPNGYNNKAV